MRNLDFDSFRRRNLSANAFPGQAQMPLPPERPSMVDVSVDDRPLKIAPPPENIIAPDIGMNALPPIELLRQVSQPVDLPIQQPMQQLADQGSSTIGFGNLPTSSGRDPFPNTMAMASPEPVNSNEKQSVNPYSGIAYSPQHRAMDMMYEMLSQRPERGNTPLWRKIMAGFMAASRDPDTGEAMQRFQSAPYDKKVADWQNRWNSIKDLATLERYENVNQRYMTDSMLDALGRDAKNRTDQDRLTLQRMLAMDKNAWKDVNSDGDIIVIYPDRRIWNTGEKAKNFTDLQKVEMGLDPASLENSRERNRELLEELRQENRVKLEDTRQSGRVALQSSREEAAQALEELRIKGRLTVAGRKAIQSALTAENSNQVKISWMNNAKAWLAQHPEDEKWLTFDPNVAYPELKSTDEYVDSQRSFLDRLRGTPLPDKTPLEAHREEIRKAIFTDPRILRQSSSQSGGTTSTQTNTTSMTNQSSQTTISKPKMLRLIDPNGKGAGFIPEGTRVPPGFTTKEP